MLCTVFSVCAPLCLCLSVRPCLSVRLCLSVGLFHHPSLLNARVFVSLWAALLFDCAPS